jgi:uncharacterized 2Fe-2S/4Fe-4S cluster protein (DUF4445 family)
MTARYPIDLVPLGTRLEVEGGTSLDAALFPYGVEFPCGGDGTCGGCRVRVLDGEIAVTPEMRLALTPGQLSDGWRLACCGQVQGPLRLEVGQWTTPVLSDDTRFPFEAAEGCGIVVDVGTTTLVAQLVDLGSGEVVAVETVLNPQARHGADVMSRVQFATEGGAAKLTRLIRAEIGRMIAAFPRRGEAKIAMLAGNTAMHHLLSGIDVAPLAHAPFRPVDEGERRFPARELGWPMHEDAEAVFLPCLGGFVGSDILAGVIATGMADREELTALIDLGTNGEIVVGNRERLLCASTAAGPAFEGGRIRMGMRAALGAVAHVAVREGALECRVLGGGAARGICGSGLVDAAAAGLRMGLILPNGRLAGGAREFALTDGVALTQADIRELQLAKGAIAAGLRVLSERWGACGGDLKRVWLAGAFGNYVNVDSARRIGLLEVPASCVEAAGNTSLRGLKLGLLSATKREAWIAGARSKIEHVALGSKTGFEEMFVECIPFPA